MSVSYALEITSSTGPGVEKKNNLSVTMHELLQRIRPLIQANSGRTDLRVNFPELCGTHFGKSNT